MITRRERLATSGSMSPARLVLDAARCDGHGICALRCPDLIALDRFGFPAVVSAPIESERLLRRARRAAAGCPEGALGVRVEPSGGGSVGGGGDEAAATGAVAPWSSGAEAES